ncbi:MAG: hypothetical protein A2887_01765 [Alphaproteobacteria bacterium RIFCSPLOWO2_01_FULL_40_26]|nr:MAG: hypothetical protein A3D15_01730 [Alphaproteobacteria bacterium RIFCSPHIGHO2_02_FULL_40_34]OFW85577.1 MAG: hypothetical protein A2794_03640 [Alphaproteobacteria bacterium RIFCSPHIGHO2_01_FULL_40_8]OFW95005.1 MAG: hypothetical protein A2887_01765 [Alphaproteobacteria bacterium RIFCSPLOWO2_01_FULL_40_26]OFX10547.1 MAG: hypothetical protein A3H30_02425 [Alphaproteobacteria bacterium RIFCSPLOWO2_02_FULL_40_19]OFX12088.1 MAG: hypothetical protein A3G22_03095 [Alphaproteobacteria bacterium RI
MQEALFDKEQGYYHTKNPLADFITSPEISQVFGELIAACFLQIFSAKKSKVALVEMGAGKGTLFFDILITIKKFADKKISQAIDFLEFAELHIIEINPVLRKIQQEKLKDFEVEWHESFDEFLQQKNGQIFFLSNELFDCFPIDQFIKTDIGWCERLIDSERFVIRNFDLKLHQFVEKEITSLARIGAVFEYSFAARKFMTQLCEALNIHGGIAINFDYGYVQNDHVANQLSEKSDPLIYKDSSSLKMVRNGDLRQSQNEFANTLQAVKNHRKVSLFEKDCDITAHVDFSALDKIAKNFNLNSQLLTQREFLISLGIEERRKKLPNENSAIDRLIAPDQMGELFKCHIIWKE